MNISIGTYLADVEASLADLSRRDVIGRIWRKDHTVWKPEPFEITNRLGWLPITDLMAEVGKDKYLAIMAYVRQTPEVDKVLADFRRKIVERHHIATTLGYGPRFLHSTGQLHKGGPDTGLFLQITAEHEQELPIPGKPYTFGIVADAQALGDLQALKSSGRYVTRIHFSRGIPPPS